MTIRAPVIRKAVGARDVIGQLPVACGSAHRKALSQPCGGCTALRVDQVEQIHHAIRGEPRALVRVEPDRVAGVAYIDV